ncbi:MAG: hypothetical protein ACK55Z_13510, partial [bacterium]
MPHLFQHNHPSTGIQDRQRRRQPRKPAPNHHCSHAAAHQRNSLANHGGAAAAPGAGYGSCGHNGGVGDSTAHMLDEALGARKGIVLS